MDVVSREEIQCCFNNLHQGLKIECPYSECDVVFCTDGTTACQVLSRHLHIIHDNVFNCSNCDCSVFRSLIQKLLLTPQHISNDANTSKLSSECIPSKVVNSHSTSEDEDSRSRRMKNSSSCNNVKVMLTDFFHEVCYGKQLGCCPFRGCCWQHMYTYELAQHMASECEYGVFSGKVPCTHCNTSLPAEQLKHHWRVKHKDVNSFISKLRCGTSSRCINYRCSQYFEGNIQGCVQYMKHSLTCKPLYICTKCRREYQTHSILNQHNCARSRKHKAVTKNETFIDRDGRKRPKLDAVEEKLHVDRWKKCVASGDFCCPVPLCTKQFFSPTDYIQHLSKEAMVDSIFESITEVECLFCQSKTNWTLIARHINDYHRDIMRYLTKLRNGETICCPNYKCTTKEQFTAESGTKYLQHAIHCRPLFICQNCGTESTSTAYLKRHQLNCLKLCCQSCGYIARDKKQLNNHYIVCQTLKVKVEIALVCKQEEDGII